MGHHCLDPAKQAIVIAIIIMIIIIMIVTIIIVVVVIMIRRALWATSVLDSVDKKL